MYGRARDVYARTLDEIRDAGLYKQERLIVTPQHAEIDVQPEGSSRQRVLNFCANNYLGLSSHPDVIAAAHRAIDSHGFGMSSVRFICGTQDLHRTLEQKISAFFGTEDTILYGSCFDANGGLFETLLGEDDAIISDALNHASIIDGIRLCKAERHRYPNGDLEALEKALQATQGKRLRMVATDGVFSMDGYLAKLDAICDLAERYDAMVMVDDSHASGFIGKTGRGTPEHFGVASRVDVMTSTLGKALGGAAGGFTTGKREIISLLRQRSRPYLFSNSIAPAIVGASIAVLDLLTSTTELRDRLMGNAMRFREGMTAAGFTIKPGIHPIVPVMLGDARLSQTLSASLLDEGIYVIGFYFPVVPKGEARIRVQLSAEHTHEQIDRAVAAFTRCGAKLGVLKASGALAPQGDVGAGVDAVVGQLEHQRWQRVALAEEPQAHHRVLDDLLDVGGRHLRGREPQLVEAALQHRRHRDGRDEAPRDLGDRRERGAGACDDRPGCANRCLRSRRQGHESPAKP